MKWFRVYNEIIDDPKIAKMSPEVFKFFIFLLALESENRQKSVGSLSEVDIVWRLRITLKEFRRWTKQLVALKIISYENKTLRLLNWEKRQCKSDSSAERTRRYRRRHGDVTVAPSDQESDQESDTELSLLAYHDTNREKPELTEEDEISPALLKACADKISEAYKKEITVSEVKKELIGIDPVRAALGIQSFIDKSNKPSFKVLKIFINNVDPQDIKNHEIQKRIDERPWNIVSESGKNKMSIFGVPETAFKPADKKWGKNSWNILLPKEALLEEYGWTP